MFCNPKNKNTITAYDVLAFLNFNFYCLPEHFNINISNSMTTDTIKYTLSCYSVSSVCSNFNYQMYIRVLGLDNIK